MTAKNSSLNIIANKCSNTTVSSPGCLLFVSPWTRLETMPGPGHLYITLAGQLTSAPGHMSRCPRPRPLAPCHPPGVSYYCPASPYIPHLLFSCPRPLLADLTGGQCQVDNNKLTFEAASSHAVKILTAHRGLENPRI